MLSIRKLEGCKKRYNSFLLNDLYLKITGYQPKALFTMAIVITVYPGQLNSEERGWVLYCNFNCNWPS
jgi:hypothetical protein